jgi:hypothetical protein
MKTGIYAANPGPRDRWERMKRDGLARHVFRYALGYLCFFALGIFLIDYFVRNKRALALSGGEIFSNAIAGVIIGTVTSLINWRAAKKRAQPFDS